MWVVERIEDRRVDKKGKIFYLIKWKDYKRPSWEHESALRTCEDVLKEFEGRENRRLEGQQQ